MFNFLKIINPINSSMSVQCCALGKCEMRHTQLCATCKHNCGPKKEKNYYKPKT
jgi:hypothetical protein